MIRMPKFDPGKDAMSYALDLLTTGEGFRPTVYYDSVGKKSTAGYGFTAPEDLHTWTEVAAKKRLSEMVTKYDTLLRNGRIGEQYVNMNPKQQAALIDLLHQGGTGVLNFMPKFVEAVKKGNYDEAANQLDFGLKLTKHRAKKRLNYFRPEIKVPEIKTAVEQPDATRVTYSGRNPNFDDNAVKFKANLDAKKATKTALDNILQMANWKSWSPKEEVSPVELAILDMLKPKFFQQPSWTVQ